MYSDFIRFCFTVHQFYHTLSTSHPSSCHDELYQSRSPYSLLIGLLSCCIRAVDDFLIVRDQSRLNVNILGAHANLELCQASWVEDCAVGLLHVSIYHLVLTLLEGLEVRVKTGMGDTDIRSAPL